MPDIYDIYTTIGIMHSCRALAEQVFYMHIGYQSWGNV